MVNSRLGVSEHQEIKERKIREALDEYEEYEFSVEIGPYLEKRIRDGHLKKRVADRWMKNQIRDRTTNCFSLWNSVGALTLSFKKDSISSPE